MDEFGNIMVVKFEIRQFEQMFNVLQISRDQIIHRDDMVALIDEAIT
jgi:hypothetical protein